MEYGVQTHNKFAFLDDDVDVSDPEEALSKKVEEAKKVAVSAALPTKKANILPVVNKPVAQKENEKPVAPPPPVESDRKRTSDGGGAGRDKGRSDGPAAGGGRGRGDRFGGNRKQWEPGQQRERGGRERGGPRGPRPNFSNGVDVSDPEEALSKKTEEAKKVAFSVTFSPKKTDVLPVVNKPMSQEENEKPVAPPPSVEGDGGEGDKGRSGGYAAGGGRGRGDRFGGNREQREPGQQRERVAPRGPRHFDVGGLQFFFSGGNQGERPRDGGNRGGGTRNNYVGGGTDGFTKNQQDGNFTLENEQFPALGAAH